jgi:imidazolonepropionase-like amidohydrolase
VIFLLNGHTFLPSVRCIVESVLEGRPAGDEGSGVEQQFPRFRFVLFFAIAQSSLVKRFSLFSAIAFLVATLTVLAQLPEQASSKLALVHGTLINPADGKITPDATILIDGTRIAAVGSPNEVKLSPETRRKFILPGYIDTHVHFFQSGDLFTRPDVVDLTKVRPYKEEVAWIKSHLDDTFARYLRSGITSVVDVGGPMWNFEVRKIANSTAKAPRVAVAGPLISSVARPQLDLGDPPIVKIDTPEQGREFVRKLALEKPDYVKIWYIVPPAPSPGAPPASGQSDIERAALFRPVVHAVIEESHARKLRVAVHATELEAARAAVEEGADLLVHSVTNKPVDDAFVRLLQKHGTMLTPTLVVFERYARTFTGQLNLTAEEKAWGNPEVIATLDVTKLPEDKVPPPIKTARTNPDSTLDRVRETYAIAFKNLKTLENAGVPIAAGTDAGNIGTIHGPALFREFQLMKQAGLTNLQILRSATATAAKVFGGKTGSKIGTIAPRQFADFVILNSNPLDDIAHASDIQTVIKNGVVYPVDSLLR